MKKEEANKLVQKLVNVGVRKYEISDAIGVSEYTLSRWLRKDMDEQRKQRFMAGIELILSEKESLIEALSEH